MTLWVYGRVVRALIFSYVVFFSTATTMGETAATMETLSNSTVRLYFGYGSNLWLQQMATRCPDSTFAGIACLYNYRWMINSRGYANVVELDSSENSEDEKTHVWGMVYILTEKDEARLDLNEGVPYAYTKEDHDIEFWPTDDLDKTIDISSAPMKKSMLVYIDRNRTKDDKPKKEYIYRMNMGIADALKVGVPSSYVEKVMRKFIPKLSKGVEKELEVQAKKQAVFFQDEEDVLA